MSASFRQTFFSYLSQSSAFIIFTPGIGVSIRVGVSIGGKEADISFGVGVRVNVSVGVKVGRAVGVSVSVGIGVSVAVEVGVSVGVEVDVTTGVGVVAWAEIFGSG